MEHATPGQFIEGLLKERGWGKHALAMVLDVSDSIVSRIIADNRSIDPKMALEIEEIFGCSAEDLLKLQAEYNLKKVRLRVRPDSQRSARAVLFGDLPISAMIKRGWLDVDNIRNKDSVRTALCRFFKVNDLNDIELIPHAAKRTEISLEATPPQLAWIYRVKQIATEMLVADYTPQKLEKAIVRLRTLLPNPQDMRHIPRIMAETGVRFLIVEGLPRAKIDGVCFWLDESSPVIALASRYDRIDNFWFVLRHELEHVRQRHSKIMMDVDIMAGHSNLPEEEQQANHAAADFCVPQDMMDSFVRKKAPFFAERDLRGFANTIRVHPGIIAGQIQHRMNDYRRFRNHLVSVRSIVAPSAITDGWGDIFPTE